MDDLQQDAGVNEVVQDDITSGSPTDTTSELSSEQGTNNGGKAGHRMVEVPEFVLHKYDRLQKQKVRSGERITQLEAELQGLKAPSREAYGEDVDKYLNDSMSAHTQKTDAQRELDFLKEQNTTEEAAVLNESWNHRLTSAKTQHADFDEKMKAVSQIPVDPVAFRILKENPLGADVLYHLASNPGEAQMFQFMSREGQINYIAQQAAVAQMTRQSAPQAPTPPIGDETIVTPATPVPAPTPELRRTRTPSKNAQDIGEWARNFNKSRRRR